MRVFDIWLYFRQIIAYFMLWFVFMSFYFRHSRLYKTMGIETGNIYIPDLYTNQFNVT
jgi:hypothetical protein